jgi:Rod binding domain-containing protein
MQDSTGALPVSLDRTALLAGRAPAPQEKTSAAAKQFEGMLMQLLFQTLRKTVEPSGLMGESGQARSTYEYMMDQAIVDKATSSGRSWGIAERLEAAWKAADERKASTALTNLGKLPIEPSTR